MSKEIEIKFRVDDLRALARKLRASGFRMTTPRTHEMNTLYALPGEVLRLCGPRGRLRMDTRAPPKQAGRNDAHIVQDQEFVAPQKTWEFGKEPILENS